MTRTDRSDRQSLFMRELRRWIVPSFFCDTAESRLKMAVGSNDYSEILEFYEQQIEAARASMLYPKQPPSANLQIQELEVCYRTSGSHGMIQCWSRIINDIGHVAAQIKLDFDALGRPRDAFGRTNRRRLACQVVIAMRLMLYARLYYERTDNNIVAVNLTVAAMPGERAIFPRAALVLGKFSSAVTEYDRQLRRWRIVSALPIGWKDGSDAYIFDQWSEAFTQYVPGSEGWSLFPRLLSRELRFRHSISSLRQRFHELPLSFLRLGSGSLPVRILLFPARLLWSILEFLMLLVIVTLIWAFMLTAGFGLKPRRVTGTVAVTILLFSGLYFANDTTAGRCSDVSWMEAGKSLYSAIANLTSLGGAPPHCGPYTGSIASIETLAGYFLLSILAAMFFVWLRDH